MVGSIPKKAQMTGRFTLLLLWLGQLGLVGVLALFNPNHFTTIDSGYYLTSAQYLLSGQGYVYEEGDRLVWNGIFPLGYPALIAATSFLTQLPVLWASKVLNLLASAGLLCFIQRKHGPKKALLMGGLLLLGPFVKLWAHTWSEPLFLTLLFVWIYYFFSEGTHFLLTLALGLALLLVRYAGLFIVPLAAAMALFWLLKNQRQKAVYAALMAFLWTLGFIGYLWLNQVQSGEWYGGDRLSGGEAAGQVLLLFAQGLINELFLLRDTTFESGDVLFWLGAILQLVLVRLMGKVISGKGTFHQTDRPEQVPYFWLTAVAYLLFLFVLRLISPFDAPGYRLLSPFTFLVLWGVLIRMAPYISIKRIKYLALALLLASWLHLLPQTDVMAKLHGVWGQW